MITDRPTISIMGAAAKLNVSRRTIYNWIASGKVNYCRTPGGSIRLFEDELLKPSKPEPPVLDPNQIAPLRSKNFIQYAPHSNRSRP